MRGQAETDRARRRISAIMVSWRTGPVLWAAIEAVLEAADIDELVLVNHDNPPETRARLRLMAEAHEKMVLVETGANLGFSKGCNRGAALAGGTHLLFLNPDAVIPSGAAARLAETGRALKEPWIAGARILDVDGEEQRGGRRGALTLWTAFVSMTGLSRLAALSTLFRDMHRENEPCPDAMIEVATVSGAAMLMSRGGFERLGGFDEGYFLHVEDVDMCRRAREAGGEVVFEPRAQLVHYGATSRAGVFAVERHKAMGLTRYFRKFSSGAGRLVMWMAVPAVFGAVMLRAALLKAGFGIGLVARRRQALRRLRRRQAAAKAAGAARQASR